MATPADQRLLELLDKWLKSLELHARYCSLDDDSYWKIQPWVEHQRPSRWIIDLAVQKTMALRNEVQERVKAGDSRYSDSMELMIFLANLVGSEHIERFIPLADAQGERAPVPKIAADDAARASSNSATSTREMPQFVASKRTPPPEGSPQVARTERKNAKAAGKQPAPPAARRDELSDVAREQVVADAARLVQWGRKWYELPELIARMAGRPSLHVVRRILKENKSSIDAKAAGGAP